MCIDDVGGVLEFVAREKYFRMPTFSSRYRADYRQGTGHSMRTTAVLPRKCYQSEFSQTLEFSHALVSMMKPAYFADRKDFGLRPGPQQRWKLPVGAFIEECCGKRFGAAPESDGSRRAKGESGSNTDDALKMARARTSQVEDLVCYVANLFEDLEKWLEHGKIASEVLAQVCREFPEIADALEAGASFPQMPEIPDPPAWRSTRSKVFDRSEHTFDDDGEIPF